MARRVRGLRSTVWRGVIATAAITPIASFITTRGSTSATLTTTTTITGHV